MTKFTKKFWYTTLSPACLYFQNFQEPQGLCLPTTNGVEKHRLNQEGLKTLLVSVWPCVTMAGEALLKTQENA